MMSKHHRQIAWEIAACRPVRTARRCSEPSSTSAFVSIGNGFRGVDDGPASHAVAFEADVVLVDEIESCAGSASRPAHRTHWANAGGALYP